MKMLSQSSRRMSLPLTGIYGLRSRSLPLLPGLILTGAIAVLSLITERTFHITVLNPLLISVVLGIGIQNLWDIPTHFRAGIQFSMKRILRLAVILLGVKLSFTEILEIGPTGLIIVASTAISTFYLTCWLGKCLNINRKLTQLIAAGTSICGASAVVATNAVIDGSEEDMTYAITSITGLGTCAMLLYPLVPGFIQMSPETFGIWCGASIHEVAQVIAAAFQNGTVSGEFATITKLSRVLLLIPLVFTLGWRRSHPCSTETPEKFKIPIPWFVVFFGLLVVLNSLNLVSDTIKPLILTTNQFLLCLSLAAMGLETNLKRLTKIGLKPIYLAVGAWLFLAITSLTMTCFLT